MKMHLKPYPEYKDCDAGWLGKIPGDWEVHNLRTILTPQTQRNQPDLPLLSVVREKGVIVRNVDDKDENHNYIPDDLSNYKVVNIGQFAMNKMKAWQGSYGVSKYQGIVSPAYYIFDLNGVQPDFFHAAVRSKAYVPFFGRASDGVRVGQWDLSLDAMKNIPFTVPPLPEQQQIVRFLRAAESRINRFIRNKRRLIALLKEQKQAIISQAVTRGIDPNVRLKPSGIDWLGDIPEHWEPVKLGFFIDLLSGFAFQSEGFTNNSSDIRLLRGVNISPGSIRWGDVVRWPVPNDNRLERYFLNAGDTVIGMDRPWISTGMRVAVIKEEDTPSLLLQRVGRIRAKKPLCQEYLNLLLLTDQFVNYFQPILTGISVPHISPGQIAAFRFALPPENEQVQILSHINKDSCALEKAISRTEHEIELINEYRTRLVADVVTGQVDVRSVKLEERSVNENEDIDEEAIIEDNGIEDDDEAFTEGAEGDDDA